MEGGAPWSSLLSSTLKMPQQVAGTQRGRRAAFRGSRAGSPQLKRNLGCGRWGRLGRWRSSVPCPHSEPQSRPGRGRRGPGRGRLPPSALDLSAIHHLSVSLSSAVCLSVVSVASAHRLLSASPSSENSTVGQELDSGRAARGPEAADSGVSRSLFDPGRAQRPLSHLSTRP